MKRLYRVENGQILAGVCGGIAEYLGVDPTLVRVIWAILSLHGVGVLAYLICALVIPSESQVQ